MKQVAWAAAMMLSMVLVVAQQGTGSIPAVVRLQSVDPDDRYWDPQFGPRTGDTLMVSAVVVKGDSIIVGGYFRTVGGQEANSLALWDGNRWQPLLPGGVRSNVGQPGNVTALALAPNGDLIIAGQFASVGGVAATNLVRYNWQTVQPIPASFTGGIASAVFMGNDLYVGGAFNSINDVPGTKSIARWDGSAWHSVGGGVEDGYVSALYTDGTNLYAGGSFQSIGGVAATAIARWDGMQWHAMGEPFRAELPNVKPQVLDIDQLPTGRIVIGGDFYRSGTRMVRYLAWWDGTQWQEIGPPDGLVTALAVWNGGLYISGGFEKIGTQDISLAAWWDGAAWHPMGGDQLTSTMMVLQPTRWGVVGGGSFDILLDNGFPVRGIATWDGTAWVGIGGNRGNGVDGTVSALASDDAGNLYALGAFTQAGPNGPRRFARFTGTRWESPGMLPLNEQQRPFHLMTRYRGGTFAIAAVFNLGNQAVPAVLQFDPSTGAITELARVGGTVTSRSIFALAYDAQRDRLYCGGNFRTLNGDSVRGIAVFDGQQWRGLGGGIPSGQINAVAILPDGSIVAAGTFTSIGGINARAIARWDGSTWSPLGDGVSMGAQQGTVYALWVQGRTLFVAGSFDRAGDVPCANIARWDLDAGMWSALTGGTNGPIYAITGNGEDIFIGGDFTRAGDIEASSIARYSLPLQQWYRLGSGIEGGAVRTLTWARGALCAGGAFSRAGGRPSQSVARWVGGVSSVRDERLSPVENQDRLVLVPQPFGERATAAVELTVPVEGQVTLDAYALDGRFIGRLWSGMLPPGRQQCLIAPSLLPPGAVIIVARHNHTRTIGWVLGIR